MKRPFSIIPYLVLVLLLAAAGCSKDKPAALTNNGSDDPVPPDTISNVRIKLAEQLSFYGIYDFGQTWRTCAVNDGNATRLNGYMFARKLSVDEKKQVGNRLELNFTLQARYDGWDRIAEFGYIKTPLNYAGPLQPDSVWQERTGIARFITPYFLQYNAFNKIDYSFDVSAFAPDLRSTDKDVWIVYQVAANPTYTDPTKKDTGFCALDGFRLDASFLSNGSTANDSTRYFRNLFSCNITGTAQVSVSFELAKPVRQLTAYITNSGHGNEEGLVRRNTVLVDNTQKGNYSTKVLCTPASYYDGINPNGAKGPGVTWRYPTRNWCQGGTVPPAAVLIGDLPAGTHTFTLDMTRVIEAGGVARSVVAPIDGNLEVTAFLSGVQ
ncbi:peptide-N-glycosidase F-related protein [Chitinophaga agrisoli]|nr:peptide-N-glycosidase F-related protein [Chitinophaga agrisoli]